MLRLSTRCFRVRRSCCAFSTAKTSSSRAFRFFRSDYYATTSEPYDTRPSIAKMVEQAADLLPNQGILENFIHHNPLEDLESLSFKEALEHVHTLESYMSPGERVFSLVQVDPRKRVNEALVDLSSAFLDRGAAKWAPQFRDKGFLYFFAALENLGFPPWRKHARVLATRVLNQVESTALAEEILQENLQFFGIPPEEWTSAIRSMLLELRGWAGMFRRMEIRPLEAPANTNVRLVEFCAVQSILMRSSIEALVCQSSGWDTSMQFSQWLSKAPTIRERDHETTHHTSAIAFVDQSAERREVLETEFKHTLLNAIGTKPIVERDHQYRPILQVYTCIDDRECSFRRYIEEANPKEIETFGVAGFFGIPIRFQPVDGRDQMILAPEGQNPTAIMVEREGDHEKSALFNQRRRLAARLSLIWENASFSPMGSLFLSVFFFPLSIGRLLLMGFSPVLKQSTKERNPWTIPPKPGTDFQLPFSPEQAATLLARTFKDIGTHDRFAPIVIVLGHGAISINNPFAAAYNCGACGGREGGPNARLLARLANDKTVRAVLSKDHGICIPVDTVFIGGLHNTTTDTVAYFDLEKLSESHRSQFVKLQQIVDGARGKNALERCKKFLLANHVHTSEEALRHVQMRSTDAAEVRPELNHATNAAVVIGRRDLTKGLNLDRRAFLPSYDPFSDDASGTNLEHVLAPALIVCSGINLEYLFSTTDADHHGAGTKAPLNIVGNIGVLQGTSGDLRPGLPTQMTEMHTPVRALFIVDAPIERIEAVLSRRKELRQLVRNEWVRFFVRDPKTNRFFYQSHGEYIPIDGDERSKTFVSFEKHLSHGMDIARREAIVYWAANSGMLLACGVPIYLFGADAMNPHGVIIALCGTLLSLPVLAFSRRYLHGEFMFGRFAFLSVGLLAGFNIVSTAPTIEHAMAGWGLFGFASTFLIGAYNDRSTVRNNATFAFAAYRISDIALLVAATFTAHGVAIGAENHAHGQLVAGGLLVAALLKSSQFPLTSLFVRSMEGPTPASALGYAGLSAHVGVVLLTSTMPLWFGFDWARVTLGSVGLVTAVYGSLVSKIRADRKGAIANATSATIGLIFVTLSLGYSNLALLMSFGHAAFRMTQILRSPNVIRDSQKLRDALGRMPWPKIVPNWLYRISWRFQRFHSDFHLTHLLHRISRPLHMPTSLKLTKIQQWLVTGVSVILAGAPFTPLSHFLEDLVMELLPTHPFLAGLIMFGQFVVSVVLIRFLFLKVLNARRFHKIPKPSSNKSSH
jgi:uncharacterized protein YbcC (UPF0753/DUF2309 family)